jgi:hypothetical protein
VDNIKPLEKSITITYSNYREKFLASFNDEGFDVYGENKVVNMRLIKIKRSSTNVP